MMNYLKTKMVLLSSCQVIGLCFSLLTAETLLAADASSRGGEISSINSTDRTMIVSGRTLQTDARTRFYGPDGKTIPRSQIEVGTSITYREKTSAKGGIATEIKVELN